MKSKKELSFKFEMPNWMDIVIEAKDYEQAKERFNKLMKKDYKI